MLTLHDSLISGNCHKVRLVLHKLGIPFRRIGYDVTVSETRTPAFLALNPNGRVPVLEFEDGRTLAESNAILFHLAEGTALLSADPFERAKTLEWMFFEQYSHEPYIAVARAWKVVFGLTPERERRLPELHARGHAALGVMEGHLAGAPFLAGARPSIADIALYPYTHLAPEGGFGLGPYPAVRAWLARVAAEPGHVAVDWTPEDTA